VAVTKRAAYSDDEYWGRPVPGFGTNTPPIWVVGLAPGAHGANRTGRMFTGDRSGDWLFAALHRAGLAALPASTSREDGQRLADTRITAAVHCAPPDNRPTAAEQHECSAWLDQEVRLVEPHIRTVLALGGLAWTATVRALARCGWGVPRMAFGHGASIEATSPSGRPVLLVASYHPSQQNTFTRRLTETMLDGVLVTVREAAGLG
jgi:uracil-DNA glycosylase family 4